MIKTHPAITTNKINMVIYQHFLLQMKQIPHDLLKQNTIPEIFHEMVQRQNKVQFHGHYTRWVCRLKEVSENLKRCQNMLLKSVCKTQ